MSADSTPQNRLPGEPQIKPASDAAPVAFWVAFRRFLGIAPLVFSFGRDVV